MFLPTNKTAFTNISNLSAEADQKVEQTSEVARKVKSVQDEGHEILDSAKQRVSLFFLTRNYWSSTYKLMVHGIVAFSHFIF